MAKSIMDFIEENYKDLLTFAIKLSGNWADGEDVLQTVAAKICAKQDDLKDLAYCKSYLMTCIRNATFNLKRTKARQRVADVDFEKLKEVLPDSRPKREFEAVEWIESLEQHLGYYDEESRKAFIAYYVDQVPLEEVAASLGLTKRQTTKKFESMRNYLKRHYKHLFIQLSVCCRCKKGALPMKMTRLEWRYLQRIALDHPYYDTHKPPLSDTEARAIMEANNTMTGREFVDSIYAKLGMTRPVKEKKRLVWLSNIGELFTVPPIRKIAIAVLVVVLLTIFFAATPTGRAIADSVIHYIVTSLDNGALTINQSDSEVKVIPVHQVPDLEENAVKY